MSNLTDVSKGNSAALFILSLPLLVIAYVFWGLFVVFAYVALLIGRRRAMNVLYKTKEWM
jgi:hypothetical protein